MNLKNSPFLITYIIRVVVCEYMLTISVSSFMMSQVFILIICDVFLNLVLMHIGMIGHKTFF